jgi:AcrR family transcriptional regulator
MSAVPAPSDPKTRILSTAVSLFAQRGVAGVSLRDLTALAGVNIAAVNYHFGSKAALEEAVFEDVAIRVNERRLVALEKVMQAAADAGELPATADVLHAFTDPYLSEEGGSEGQLLARLILKHRISPTPLTTRLMRTHFDPMAKKFVEALALANPGIDAEEFVWRYMFMTSAVVLTATDRHKNNRVRTISGGRVDAADTKELTAALARFLVGGLTAPGPAPRRSTRGRSRK